MEMVYGPRSSRIKQEGDTFLHKRLQQQGLRMSDDKERWDWSERRGMIMTPRRTPDAYRSKAERARDYQRAGPIAEPRALYPIPRDRLVTDVFAEWQDGGSDPMIPSSSLGSRIADAAAGVSTGWLGEGMTLPPPAHIVARREVYSREDASRQQSEEHGELTEPIAEILLEADALRSRGGDEGVGPRPTRPGRSVFAPEALAQAKAEFAAQEEQRKQGLAAKKEEAARQAVEREEQRAAAAAKRAAKAAQAAKKDARSKLKAEQAQREADELREDEAARKREMDAFRAGGAAAYEEAKAANEAARRAKAEAAAAATSSKPTVASTPLEAEQVEQPSAAPDATSAAPAASPEAEVDISSSPLVQAAPEPTPLSQVAMDEEELRAKLRPVFDKFDEDGSGSVSSSEMENMLTSLGMSVTGIELGRLMAQADPNGDGIDFDEFVIALRKQMKGTEDGGLLSNVVMNAAGAFGWLNPTGWFK